MYEALTAFINDGWQSIRSLYEGDRTVILWLTGLSVLSFVGTIVAVPIIVRRLPADYFLPEFDGNERLGGDFQPMPLLVRVLKNILGCFLIFMGLLMLVGPGQGLLTIFMGILLIDFPRKKEVEMKLAQLGPINRLMSWIRTRADKPPLQFPNRQGDTGEHS